MESESRDGLELTSCEILRGVTLSAPAASQTGHPASTWFAGQGGGFGDNRRLGPREVAALFGNREGPRHEGAAWSGGA